MDATALQGRTVVPAEAIDSYSIDSSDLGVMTRSILHRTREPELYEPPKVLIRRGLIDQQRIAATLSEDDALFNDSVIGISGPAVDRNLLAVVTGLVNSSFAQYFHFLTGSAWGVERDTVDKNEHLAIPVPTLSASENAKVVTLVDRLQADNGADRELRSALDRVFFDAFGLSDREEALIGDRVSLAIDHFRTGQDSVSFTPPGSTDIEAYLTIVERTVQELLPGTRVRTEVSEPTPFYLAASVSISAAVADLPATPTLIGAQATSLMNNEVAEGVSSSTVLQPSLLFVDGSSVHLVKPRETRYWSPTSAYSDGTELVAALAVAPSQQDASR